MVAAAGSTASVCLTFRGGYTCTCHTALHPSSVCSGSGCCAPTPTLGVASVSKSLNAGGATCSLVTWLLQSSAQFSLGLLFSHCWVLSF